MKKLIILILTVFAVSCTKDTFTYDDLETGIKNGVFICNEGNFMSGNASLSIYDPTKKMVQNQIYNNTNKAPLGDVCQSMTIIGNKGFVVVNNSAKVVVIDLDTYKHLGKIEGLNSPRYIAQINDEKIYITDLYSNAIAVVNPKTYQVIKQIKTGRGTEQMVRYGDYIFACSWSFNNQVYRIDTRTDELIDSVTVTKQPNSMVIDRNNKIWVLSDGGYKGSPYGQETAALTRIDAKTFSIEKTFKFPNIDLSPSELTVNKTKNLLYFLNGGWGSSGELNGLYRGDISMIDLPTQPFIPEKGRLFYALGIDPNTEDIYLSDAIDYVQKGIILRYNSNGEKTDEFKTDIIPGAFCFRQQ